MNQSDSTQKISIQEGWQRAVYQHDYSVKNRVLVK